MISLLCTHLVDHAILDAEQHKLDKIKFEALTLNAIPDIKLQKPDRSCNHIE